MKFLQVKERESQINFDDIEVELNTGRTQYQPQDPPENPTEGFTYYDRTTKIVRTWNGTVWKDHYA